jgi:hypothetical protein
MRSDDDVRRPSSPGAVFTGAFFTSFPFIPMETMHAIAVPELAVMPPRVEKRPTLPPFVTETIEHERVEIDGVMRTVGYRMFRKAVPASAIDNRPLGELIGCERIG